MYFFARCWNPLTNEQDLRAAAPKKLQFEQVNAEIERPLMAVECRVSCAWEDESRAEEETHRLWMFQERAVRIDEKRNLSSLSMPMITRGNVNHSLG